MIILKILLFLILYLFLFLLGLILVILVSPIKGRLVLKTGILYFKGSYLFGLIKIYMEDGFMVVKALGFKVHSQRLTKESQSEESTDEKESFEDETIEDTEDTEDSEGTEGTKKKEKKKSFKRPSKEILVLALKLIKKLIRRIAPRYAYFKLRLGLDDPYYTGLTGLIYSVLFYPLNQVQRYEFIYESVYHELALDYEGDFYVNFSIIQLVAPVLRFLIRKPIRQYLGISLFKKNKDAA